MENDLIRRSAVIDAIRGEREYLIAHKQLGAEHVLAKHADAVIDSIPAVDAVEVCRCGDCRYKDDGIDEDGIPFLKCLHGRSYGGTRINDYCSWGKRREDGDA